MKKEQQSERNHNLEGSQLFLSCCIETSTQLIHTNFPAFFFFFLRTECNIVQFLLLQFLSGILKMCGGGEGGGREHANIGDFQKGDINFSWWRLTIYMLSYNKKILCIQAECRCF